MQRHHQVLREGETVETLPARPVPISLLWNVWQSMKTGHRDERYPGHTEDSYNHLGHDLRFLPFIYLFSPPHTPMSTCTHAPGDLGVFSYSVSWKQVLRTLKEMSKGRLQSRPGRQQLPCRAGFFPIAVCRDTGRASHNYRDSQEFITHRYRHRPTRSVIPLFPGG